MPNSPSKPDYRLTAAQRIPRRLGFGHSLNAQQLGNAYFKLFFVANQREVARLGMIVSKRHFPLAVTRNQHKRLIRETFRLHPLAKMPLDIVVMARRVSTEDVIARRAALVKLFSQLQIRCG